jgi:acyl carrier protein
MGQENSNGIAEKIKDYIRSASFSNVDNLDNDLLIFKEGILDSMGLISLFTFLEQEFNIQITDADLVEENFESVNAITNFVIQRQS